MLGPDRGGRSASVSSPAWFPSTRNTERNEDEHFTAKAENNVLQAVMHLAVYLYGNILYDHFDFTLHCVFLTCTHSDVVIV